MTDPLHRSLSRLQHGVTYRGLTGTLTLNDDDSLTMENTVAGRLFQSYLLPGWTVDEAADEHIALTQRANAYGWHQDAVERVYRVLNSNRKRRARTSKALNDWLGNRALSNLDDHELLRLAYHLSGVAHYRVMARRPQQTGFVHDWLVLKPVHGRKTRHLKPVERETPDAYMTHRFQMALYRKHAEQDVKRALEMGLTVNHHTSYDYYDTLDWIGEIKNRQPAGDPWIDYVPLVNSREYAVARGEDDPSRWIAYFIPGYGFQERLDTYRGGWYGMAKHDSWNAARRETIKSAREYLAHENGSVGIEVRVDGTVVHDEVWYTMSDYDVFVEDGEDGDENALRILADAGELGWVIEQAEIERAELTAGQVGPR